MKSQKEIKSGNSKQFPVYMRESKDEPSIFSELNQVVDKNQKVISSLNSLRNSGSPAPGKP